MRKRLPNSAIDPRRRSPSTRPGLLPILRRLPLEVFEGLQPAETRLARLEAVLFLADEPLASKKLLSLTGIPDLESLSLELDRLRNRYEIDDTPFQIREIAGGFLLLTRERYHFWLTKHFQTVEATKLTPALMEALAIVAYRQPITRAEVDQLRGVQSQEILNQLIERGLVRIAGRHDSLGRPALYGTTRQFLQTFGLKEIGDLPGIDK